MMDQVNSYREIRKKRLARSAKKQNRGDPTMSAPPLAEAGSCCAGPSTLNAESSIRGHNNQPSENGHRKKELIGQKKVVEDIPIWYSSKSDLLSTADSIPCGPGDSKSDPADSKSAKGNILLILLIWRSCAEPTFQLQIPKARKEPSFSFCSSG